MRHYEEMRDALRNGPQALIFLDAAQVAKQAFELVMLTVRPPVPAKTSAPRLSRRSGSARRTVIVCNRLSNVAGPRMENVGFRFPMLRR